MVRSTVSVFVLPLCLLLISFSSGANGLGQIPCYYSVLDQSSGVYYVNNFTCDQYCCVSGVVKYCCSDCSASYYEVPCDQLAPWAIALIVIAAVCFVGFMVPIVVYYATRNRHRVRPTVSMHSRRRTPGFDSDSDSDTEQERIRRCSAVNLPPPPPSYSTAIRSQAPPPPKPPTQPEPIVVHVQSSQPPRTTIGIPPPAYFETPRVRTQSAQEQESRPDASISGSPTPVDSVTTAAAAAMSSSRETPGTDVMSADGSVHENETDAAEASNQPIDAEPIDATSDGGDASEST